MNPRILLTATGSGCGKTTVTIALLKALSMRGIKAASFKCGPDYIDPMYHRKTFNIPSYNLDPFFCDRDNLCDILANGLKGNDIAVIEGVMGYYDGYGDEGLASTWDVANNTDTNAILIINAKGMSHSVKAIIKGFLSYKENHHIKGVIFNNISKSMYPMLSKMAQDLSITPLGFLPYKPELSIESRHLGLVTADEVSNIYTKIDTLGALALENLDIDKILEIANESSCFPLLSNNDTTDIEKEISNNRLRLAIAKDDAFCFIYQENLDLFEKLGCELVFFSPLNDASLPDNCHGLYLPGGYPELYAKKLSSKKGMLSSIKDAIENGLPTVAECGGFMYLHEAIENHTMVSVIKGTASKNDRLVRFGYATMKAKEDGLLLKKDDTIRVHEFHYYDSNNNGASFEVTKASNGTKYECAYSTGSIYAGYPHLYFRANINAAMNFVEAMNNYRGTLC